MRHPELMALLDLPFDELLDRAAEHFVEEFNDPESFTGNEGEWTVHGARVILAENEHATESLRIYVAKRTVSAIYESRYKGEVGQILHPNNSWGIAKENNNSLYYWDEKRHGDTASLFTLAGTECDEVPNDHLGVRVMQWYLSLAIYLKQNPEIRDEFSSTIPKADVWAALSPSDT